ncbi:zinc finger protein 226-like [Centruroides sculpturatus]|uniref:zinc finger protein 226-like n=1 Tax=Centruroides sculpturatus TaxID=218467 RepID=UPI000C6E4CD4|nr:zinc finger protein 226-like [Centruroides sculpturatus]XP_023212283.1 zinc finger protein 226-like [Centruroides sculpturatus]XP_023212284.1 zinc finger protein 226-like [Centruroides sculpturatus]
MKIKVEPENKYSEFTFNGGDEKFDVLNNCKKEFNTDNKTFCRRIKSEPLEHKNLQINIKGKPISTNNTNGSTIWSHSGYKIERDIKKEEVEENYEVKHGIKSECKVDLKKLKIEVKTEDYKEVVHLPDDNEQVMFVNNEFFTPERNSNGNEMNIEIEKEEQIEKRGIQQNSEKEEHFKYNIKTNKYVPSTRKCNTIHDKIKRKYFKIMFASHSKQEFTCDLCKQTFKNKSILQTHLFCHIGKKPFRCTTCNKKFLWQFLLRRHTKKHKTGNEIEVTHRNLRLQPSENRMKSSPRNGKKSNIQRKNVYCDICGKSVPYGKGRLERHMRIHRSNACKICGKEFRLNRILRRHERTHSEERPFKCDICNKSFKLKEYLKKHYEIHNDECNYICQVCNKSFKTKKSLEAHKIVHSNQFNHTCQVCNKSFKRSFYLKRHTLAHSNVHSNQFNHSCQVCNKSFKRSSYLKRHTLAHSNEYKYFCDICNKFFKSKESLPKHKLIHSKKSNIKQEYVYCDICGKRVPYGKGRLERHMKIHRVHACNICGKEFKSKYMLLYHERIHNEDRPFKCDICSKSFKRKDYLKIHHTTHSDERNYSCPVCNKYFKTKVNLEAHKVVHNNQFNYTCHICNKSFKRSASLKHHSPIHSNEYKYSCGICNKYFKTKNHLSYHKLVHSNQFDHTCQVCNKSFTCSSGLKQHIRKYCNKCKYFCRMCKKYFKTKHCLEQHNIIHRDT